MKKLEGRIKWYDQRKGYGFIFLQGMKKDIFFHVSDIRENLPPIGGERVIFLLDSNEKGAIARDIEFRSSPHTLACNELRTSHNTHKTPDDRINCPTCGKKIVPRVVFDRGEADHSVCPFCMSIVEFNWAPIPTAEPWLTSFIKDLVSFILSLIAITAASMAFFYLLFHFWVRNHTPIPYIQTHPIKPDTSLWNEALLNHTEPHRHLKNTS